MNNILQINKKPFLMIILMISLGFGYLMFNQCAELLINHSVLPTTPENTIFLFNQYLKKLNEVATIEESDVFFRLDDVLEEDALEYANQWQEILQEVAEGESYIPQSDIDLFKEAVQNIYIKIVDKNYITETECDCEVLYYFSDMVYVEEHFFKMIKDGDYWIITQIE
jgi:hypothetical protein